MCVLSEYREIIAGIVRSKVLIHRVSPMMFICSGRISFFDEFLFFFPLGRNAR